MDKDLQSVRQRFIEEAGHTTQSLGAGRVIGQIFAHVYFSRDPQSLDDLTGVLGISKGSASMAVRQLEQWGALRRVWIKGDRKDYYESTGEFGNIIRKAVLDAIGQRMELSGKLVEEAEGVLESKKKRKKSLDEDWKFFERQLHRFRDFRNRTQWLWEKFILSMLSR